MNPRITGTIYALVAFTAVLLVGLGTHYSSTPRVVEFNPPMPSSPSVSMTDARAAVNAYADFHNLASCTDPANAALDDVILAVPSDPTSGLPVSTEVLELGFDTALAGEHWNVLACTDPATS